MSAHARVGADVVHVGRLSERLAGSPGLAEQIFGAAERRAASGASGPRALALAFAAKEAFLKALGRGLNAGGPDAWLTEIEVERGPDAPARLVLGPRPARRLAHLGLTAVLALSAAGEHATATVLLLPDGGAGRGEAA